MKVQGINNQNSISHKAYFKPNAEFKKLWASRPINKFEFNNKLYLDIIDNIDLKKIVCKYDKKLNIKHEKVNFRAIIYNSSKKFLCEMEEV